jgi:hypothetical protein
VAKLQTNYLPDAAESNAGDNYHVLWAIRKSLELLNFSPTGLKALSLESVSETDEKLLDPKSILGVDITEYYGGADLAAAVRVVISQVKYSGRHSTKSWTAAELCQGKKKGTAGSVIDRLGYLYKELVLKYPAHRSKLTVQLVSNRPASADLIELTQIVKKLHGKKTRALSYATFFSKFSVAKQKIITRFMNAGGLDQTLIVDFLLALDFSECGAGSPLEQKAKSFKAISEFGNLEGRDQHAKLRELITERMLPNNRDHHTLSKEDILYQFGFNDLSDLLPVQNDITLPEKIVVRKQVNDIVNSIVTADASIICLHGSAGIGKSTTMTLITSSLPTGSQTVLFDCYGGGAYNDTDDRRHTPEYAFLQLSNQIALNCGSAFLLLRNANSGQFVKELKKRIVEAVSILRKNNPEAWLILLIDAADNSVSAARFFNSENFVQELAQMGLPEGCKVVFSARTERVNTLLLPTNSMLLQLEPFTMEETGEFLKDYYPVEDTNQTQDFHSLTYGIPRVMAYVLDMEGDSLTGKMDFLKPAGKTLDKIFEQRILIAEKRSGGKETMTAMLTSLVALPRPVPEFILQKFSGLSQGILNDLRTDLWHGLVFNNGQYLFRDEDFETFIRTKYPVSPAAYATIAQILLEECAANEYASVHLGSFLYHSASKDELIDIVINRKFLDLPTDPIKNKEVFVERVRLAMRLSNTGDLDFYKLQVIAAEAAKSNEFIENILLNHAELAAAYGDLQTNQKLYFQSGNPNWFGPVHFRNAAVFARDPQTQHLAKEHLQKARAWLQYRDRLNSNEQADYEFNAKDIAYGAEAILRLYGVDRCAQYLYSWTPKSFGFEVFMSLLQNLIGLETNATLNRWLRKFYLRVDLVIGTVNLFFKSGLKVGFEWVHVFNDIDKITRCKKELNLDFQQQLMGFIEFAIFNKTPLEKVAVLLGYIKLKYPSYLPGFYKSEVADHHLAELDLVFRVKAFEKHSINGSYLLADFYPHLAGKDVDKKDYKATERYKEDKKKFDRVYAHLLRIYDCRIKFFLKKSKEPAYEKEVKQIIKLIKDDWELKYYNDYNFQSIYLFMILKLLDVVFYLRSPDTLHLLSDSFGTTKGDTISPRLTIAGRLSRLVFFKDDVLKLLQQVESAISSNLLPGSEIVDNYKDATIIASRISRPDGKYYFDKMVLASAEIDEEAYDQIRALSVISARASFDNPKLAFELARYVEYCSIKLGDSENFPWTEALDTLGALDKKSVLAVNCRWDHRNIRKQREHFAYVLRMGLANGSLDYRIVGGLWPINPYFGYAAEHLFGPIIYAADKAGDKAFKTAFVKDFLADLKLIAEPGSDFSKYQNCYDLIKSGKFIDGELVVEFGEYLTNMAKLTGRLKPEKEKPKTKPATLPTAFKQQLAKVKITGDLDLAGLFRKLRKTNSNGYVPIEAVFVELRKKARGNESHLLTAISLLTDDYISYYEFIAVLAATISEWHHLAVLKTWRKEAFKTIIKNWFGSLIAYRSLDYTALRKLQELFEETDSEVTHLINSLFPERMAELPAGVIYNLFRLSIDRVDEAGKEELITWTLSRWTEPIKDDFGDGPFTADFIPPDNNLASVSATIQYNLGHPVRAIRWRAAHCIRRMMRYDQTTIIDRLLTDSTIRSLGQFQDKDRMFFWMSARLYLFIALERATKEAPAQFKPMTHRLLSELEDNQLPHAQIKYFIRSACMFLANVYPNAFTDKEKNSIFSSLAPVRKLVKQQRTTMPYSRRSKPEGLRFDFDTTDTVPYWYDGLAEVFDINTHDLMIIIDRIISEDWGFTGDPRKLDFVDADYRYTSNNHGTEPRIEDVKTYFEYHGMFCAAFEILKSRGALKKSTRETWDSWIAGWGLCWPNCWLSDLRDPLPLETRFWEHGTIDREWEFSVQIEDFHERVGILPFSTKITLDENSYVYFGKDKEHVQIASGLVSAETGPSLLAALQTSLSYDVYIPHQSIFRDDLETELIPLTKKFVSEPLAQGLENENEGIDDRDVKFHNINKNRTLPSAMLQKILKLSVSQDQRFSFVEGLPKWVTHFEVWDNLEEDRYSNNINSSGHRFSMQKDRLLEVLKKRNKCLIINCQIDRDLEHRSYDEYMPDYILIYLIYPNGNTYTINGNYSIR